MNTDALRYDKWFTTPEGSHALAAERRLLDSVVAQWPRRNQRVLEIGCGTGLFQQILYDDGFTVAGLDKSPQMISEARKRLGPNAELYVGNGEALPFADKEYDFCVLWTVLEFCDDPGLVLAEAARVAAKGLLIGFLNRHSCYYLARGWRWPWQESSTLSRACWYTWPEMRALALVNTGFKPARTRSVLPGPPWTWRDTPPWGFINRLILPSQLGAICAMRIDLVGYQPLTPIYSWKTEPGIG
ncbi:MAG: class I SAM-dependent methyltransferase [Deltaproteobacteria bacterium HGW-Deltaproteobacteria-8]|jgi:SAM-dependent methyltransferase|nr:MAG: class I SAM-dependent methyltransferase [Deltaproteobacteria bacterium HGW-Deltaproteobacteria-8]